MRDRDLLFAVVIVLECGTVFTREWATPAALVFSKSDFVKLDELTIVGAKGCQPSCGDLDLEPWRLTMVCMNALLLKDAFCDGLAPDGFHVD